MKCSQPHLESSVSLRTTLKIVMIILAQKKTSYYPLSQLERQDDLWDAMEEYKEAKEMMLDIGRQILLKVYPS